MSLRARLLAVLVSLTAVGLSSPASRPTPRSAPSSSTGSTARRRGGAPGDRALARARAGPVRPASTRSARPTPASTSASVDTERHRPLGCARDPPGRDAAAAARSLCRAGDRGGRRQTPVHRRRGQRAAHASGCRLEPLGSGQLLVVAAPLDEVDDDAAPAARSSSSSSQLSVLGAVFLLGLCLVRVGLRPLGRIEHTAAAIAGGDLSQRVENDDPRTEVGRLGGALNAMLGQIEEAFDERTASEQRLRRFVADASHELRTPLAAVRAYAELFDRGARERPDDLERAMTGIQRESRRMGLLVDDLLLLARLDQGRPLERKPVDARRGRARGGRGRADARPGPRDRPRVRPAAWRWRATASGCGRCSTTCSRTSASHTPPGSAAAVRVLERRRRRGASRSPTRARASPTSSSTTSSSASTAATRRARATPGGAGLGLAIAAAIAESHGGSAAVVNEGRDGGTGLTVRVVLPLAPAAQAAEPVAGSLPA